MRTYLDFEKPVAELEAKVDELRALAERNGAVSIDEEVTKLQAKSDKALKDIYRVLTPWQKTLVARHPLRPKLLDYVRELITDFTPLAGDRAFAGGCRYRGWARPLQGHRRLRDRAGKGHRHPEPHQA